MAKKNCIKRLDEQESPDLMLFTRSLMDEYGMHDWTIKDSTMFSVDTAKKILRIDPSLSKEEWRMRKTDHLPVNPKCVIALHVCRAKHGARSIAIAPIRDMFLQIISTHCEWIK